MDLNQTASILKTLNDQQLQKEYLQPAAGVPQFLILTELQRRKQLRAAAQPKPVDTTPVAQELLNSGVAATPQMSEGSAPAGMMQGGVVGYAGGGLLGDIDNLIGASQEDMKRYWEERRAKQQAARTAAGPIQPPPPMPTAPQITPAPATAPMAPMPMQPKEDPLKARFRQAVLGQESDNNDHIGTSVDGAVGPGQIIPGTWKQYAKPGEDINNPKHNRAVMDRIIDDLWAKSGGDPAKAAVGYFSGPGNMGQGDAPFKRDTADGNGKLTSEYVRDVVGRMYGIGGRTVPRPQLDKLPPMAMMPMPGRTPVDLMDVPDMPDKVDAPVEAKPEAYLAAVNAANPDMTASMMERINKAVEKNKGSKDEAINFALINAGLGMMASRSPHFLGAVGEGGIGAMKQLTGDLKDMRTRADALDDKKDSVTMAQMAAARGNYKQAAELAEKSNSFANTRYGHDMYDRRSAINERSNVIRSNVSEKNAATRADSAMQQGVMSFNKGAVNADRQAVRDWNRGQIELYRTDVRDDTQRELEAHKSALKAYGSEDKSNKLALDKYNSLKSEYQNKASQGLIPDMTPGLTEAQRAQKAHEYAMSQLSEDDRKRLGFATTPVAGPARIQMNADGSFRK